VDEQPAAAGVAVVRVVDQFGDVGDLRTGEPGGLQQRPPARGQFHAAPVAAAAHRAAGVQRDVSQFAGGTGGAAVQPAVEHDTGGEDVVDEVGRLVQRRGGVVVGLSGEPDVVFGQHLVAQVGDGDPDVTAADVDAEREPGRAGEPDDRGRPSAHRTGGGAGLFGDQ